MSDDFGRIKNGDIIAYCAFYDHVLVGLFKVISGIHYMKHQGTWSDCMIYNIEPYKLPCDKKCYLDFKKLVEDHNTGFDESLQMPNLKSTNQEKLCVPLLEKDFLKIEDALSNPKYLKCKDKENDDAPDPEIVGALLDFNNSRATSFASLFVASIFGIITLASITRTLGGDLWLYFFSLFPYFAFIIAAAYTLKRFFFYADIAEKLQYNGLQLPNKFKLEKLKLWKNEEDSIVEMDFPEYIGKGGMRSRKFLDKLPHVFETSYVIVIFFLSIVVYWTPLQDVITFLIQHIHF